MTERTIYIGLSLNVGSIELYTEQIEIDYSNLSKVQILPNKTKAVANNLKDNLIINRRSIAKKISIEGWFNSASEENIMEIFQRTTCALWWGTPVAENDINAWGGFIFDFKRIIDTETPEVIRFKMTFIPGEVK